LERSWQTLVQEEEREILRRQRRDEQQDRRNERPARASTKIRSGLKLDKYKGPITRSKSKKLCILRSGKHIPETSPNMAERNEQPEKNHEENLMRRDKEVVEEIKKT
jgi:hypothetical protein